MTTKIAEPKIEQATRKGGSRRIIYLKDVQGQKPADTVNCRIVCGTVCACASKKK